MLCSIQWPPADFFFWASSETCQLYNWNKVQVLNLTRKNEQYIPLKTVSTTDSYPHKLWLIAFLRYWHCWAVRHILKAIVGSIIQRLPDLILPGILWNGHMGLQIGNPSVIHQMIYVIHQSSPKRASHSLWGSKRKHKQCSYAGESYCCEPQVGTVVVCRCVAHCQRQMNVALLWRRYIQ